MKGTVKKGAFMKQIALIKFDDSDNPWMIYKDVGMFLYKLAKNYNWGSKYLYFNTTYFTENWNEEFQKYVEPICIGNAIHGKDQKELAKNWVQKHAKELDVLMLFNYGSTTWKLARLAKKANPNIIVYSKLDMGIGGFSHFVNHRFGITLKNYFEKLKSSYVDWFTVETKGYFDALSKTSVFKNRIAYLPNGVSLLNVNTALVEKQEKENIVLASGRIGLHVKNNELLVDAIQKLPRDIVDTWRFYFVGPYTDAFYQYVEAARSLKPYLADKIILTGGIMDRDQLYSYYKRAKIICMTSRSESTCIATLEAMYFGAYPVITRYSSFADDTTNYEKCGTIVSANAGILAEVLAKKMQDPELVAKGNECQWYARKMFNYDVLAGKLDQQLRRLMSKE